MDALQKLETCEEDGDPAGCDIQIRDLIAVKAAHDVKQLLLI